MQADSGSIRINNQDITVLGQTELDVLRTEIGFLFQGSALYDSMTVRENLEFPLRRHKKKLHMKEATESLVAGGSGKCRSGRRDRPNAGRTFGRYETKGCVWREP